MIDASQEQAFNQHELTLAGQLAPLQSPSAFAALLRTAAQPHWVVYAKRPFAGPAQVLTYLSRYTHRVAIANSRLLSMTDDKVSFLWRDYAHGHCTRTLTLDADEFLRPFLLHVLPAGFVRIRYFGLLAPRHRNPSLHLCREYLQARSPEQLCPASATAGVAKLCQHCRRGIMRLVEVLSPARLALCLLAPQPENSA